jgi:hypothetical protein
MKRLAGKSSLIAAIGFVVAAVLYAATDMPILRPTVVLLWLSLAMAYATLWVYETAQRELKRRITFLESVIRSQMVDVLANRDSRPCPQCRRGDHRDCHRPQVRCSCTKCGPQGATA